MVLDLATGRATVQSPVSLPGARVGSRPGAGEDDSLELIELLCQQSQSTIHRS